MTDKINDNILPMELFPRMGELIAMLFEVQNTQKATVFFELSGHIQNIQVRIFTPTWIPDATPSFSDSVYIEKTEDNSEYIENFITRVNEYCKSLTTS
jgi:hypothetical protein